MKKISLIIVVLITNIIHSQNVLTLSNKTRDNRNSGNYFKDTEGLLNPFIGTWVWTNATNTAKLTIKFIKKEMYDSFGTSGFKEDILLGGYKYEEHGVVVIDNLSFNTTDPNNPNFSVIFSRFLIGQGNPVLRVQMREIVKRKKFMGTFKLNANPNLTLLEPLTATMKLVPQKSWVNGTLYPNKVSLPGLTFPLELILTKQ